MSGPAAAARLAARELSRLARPVGAFDASRYFRGGHDLGFYNTGTRAVRRLARRIAAEYRQAWTVRDAMAFADALMPSRYLEVKGLAIEVAARWRRDFAPGLLLRWKRWLARGQSANWATTDAICGLLVGPLLQSHPELARVVAGWSHDRSLWVRRASAVGLIALARDGQALDLVYQVATVLRTDREDLIQKAAGWLLREAGKTDMGRLERYLRAGGADIPRTTLRYAVERFPSSQRRRLLVDTRRQTA